MDYWIHVEGEYAIWYKTYGPDYHFFQIGYLAELGSWNGRILGLVLTDLP